jgi:glycosyltransferase involved in cell wall biosynthesis
MKTIVFALGYADYAMAQSGYGCYGSELAFTYLYNQLKKKYQVYLLTDFKVPGFNLLTSEQYEKGSYDYLIVSRYINFFLYHTVRASKVLIWLHDVGLQPAFLGGHLPDGGKYLLANAPVDTIVAQTQWHSNVFASYYETKEKMEIIGNGFNQSAWTFNATSFQETVKKDEMSFIYTSSPKRGLRWLIPFFPKIRAKYPNATLHIYRGDDELTDEEKKTFPELKEQGIFYHGGLENSKLAKEILSCQLWLYPTDFRENFCIRALEAMAGGCLCICTNLAALTEIVADRGILLNKEVYTTEYEKEIFSAIEDGLKRKDVLSHKARTWALEQTWEQRAVQWDKLLGNQFQSTVEEKSNQKDEKSWKSFPNQKIALSSNFSNNLAKDWKKMFPKEVPLQLIDGERVDDAVCLVINGNNSSPRNVDHLIRMESSINRGHLPVKWKDVPSILSYNGIEWHLGLDVNTLLVHSPTKTNLFSAIISGENRLPGHSLRLQFLKFLTSKYSTDDFHLYGKHPHSYPHYKGPLNTKDSGLFSYKYTFNAENTEEKGYFTEKIVDAILAECLCFYWGCPDLERYIDPRAFIRLPLEDPEKALAIVVEAIQSPTMGKAGAIYS